MADLPPPYSRNADDADADAVSAAAVSPPLPPLVPPPSYEMVIQRDHHATSSVGDIRSQQLLASQNRHQHQQSESDHQILERIFRNRKSGGCLPESLGIALHDSALAGSEEHVAALLRANAPIAFTDSSSFAANKMPDGCALHAALRGASPHLAVLIADEFWARAYTAKVTAIRAASLFATVPAASADPFATADAKTHALLDARDGKGCTPLHIAAQAGATDAVDALLARGAAVDALDNFGRTPLHMAARYGRTETAALLLVRGADGDHLLQPALWDRAAAADDKAAKRSSNSRGRGGSSAFGAFGTFGTPSHLAELGDFGFIGRLICPLLADARKRQVELDQSGRQAAAHAPYQTFDPAPEWDGIGGRGMPPNVDDDADDCTGKPLRMSRPSAAASPSHPSLPTSTSISISASSSSFRRADVPLRLQSSSLLLSARTRQEASRRNTGSLLHTPEYSAWRRGCDTLLAEHRAQRERNRLAEVPNGMRI